MKTHDGLKLTGSLRVIATDERGGIVQEERIDNLVTMSGRNLARDLLRGVSGEQISHIALGTGATAEAEGDTALEAEIQRLTFTGVTEADGELVFSAYLPTGEANGNDLVEAGLMTAAAGGTLYARTTHGAIAKTQGVAVTYTWTVNLGAS